MLGSNTSWKAGFVVRSFLQWWAEVVCFFFGLKVWEASKPQELPNQTFDQRISEVGRAAFPRPDKNSSLGVEQNKQVGDEQSFGDRWHAEWHFGG